MMTFRRILIGAGVCVVLLAGCTLPYPAPPSTPAPTGVIQPTGDVSPSVTPGGNPTGTPISPTVELTPTGTESSPEVIPSATAAPRTPVPVIVATPEPVTRLVYLPQAGSPVAMANFIHPELGCDWMGVAGQVFDLAGAPMQSVFVEARGMLDGQPVTQLGLTGTSQAIGEGGFELKLADKPVASTRSLWLQLFDEAGKPLSAPISFDTYNGCDQNLILFNLSQVSYTVAFWLFFPMVLR